MSRAALAGGVAVLCLATVAVIALAGGDDEKGRPQHSGTGKLVWERTPKVTTRRYVPNDRLVTATMRNRGFGEIRVDANANVKLADRMGRPVKHVIDFGGRTRAEIGPGEAVKVRIAFRILALKRGPYRLELPGGGVLTVPDRGGTLKG